MLATDVSRECSRATAILFAICAVSLRINASVALGVRGISSLHQRSAPGIGADESCSDALTFGGAKRGCLARDHLVRCAILFDPDLQRSGQTCRGIPVRRGNAVLTEVARTGAAGAVVHARHHEEPHE